MAASTSDRPGRELADNELVNSASARAAVRTWVVMTGSSWRDLSSGSDDRHPRLIPGKPDTVARPRGAAVSFSKGVSAGHPVGSAEMSPKRTESPRSRVGKNCRTAEPRTAEPSSEEPERARREALHELVPRVLVTRARDGDKDAWDELVE